jgi:hypothetical protein
MEQRRLRLGDIVDDYCPRERRVTNHAIVAMVEEDVKQTRCTTCDAEHAYKGGTAPRRRKKDSTGALYKEVLAGITDGETAPVLAAPAPPPPIVRAVDVQEPVQASANGGAPHAPLGDDAEQPEHADVAEHVQALSPSEDELRVTTDVVEDGPVHRPLIRATLPRVDGHKETRQATDFTIRQSNGRGANFQGNHRGGDQRGRPRGAQGQGQGQPSNRPSGGGGRFAGARPGNQGRGASGRPPNGGFRAGQSQRRGPGGGGRKRSR